MGRHFMQTAFHRYATAALLCMLLFLYRANAADNPVSVNIPSFHPSFGVHYPVNKWFPLRLNPQITKEAQQITIELLKLDNRKPLYRIILDNPQKPITLPAFLPGGAAILQMRIKSGIGKPMVIKYQSQLQPLPSRRGARLRVCCEKAPATNSIFSGKAFDGVCGVQDMPQQGWLYCGVDLVYLEKDIPGKLSIKQLAALKKWIDNGGTAVIDSQDKASSALLIGQSARPGHIRPLQKESPQAARLIPCGRGWLVIIDPQAANVATTGIALNHFLDSRKKIRNRCDVINPQSYYTDIGDWPEAPGLSFRSAIFLCISWLLISLAILLLLKRLRFVTLILTTCAFCIYAFYTAGPVENVQSLLLEDDRPGHTACFLQINAVRGFSADSCTLTAASFPPAAPIYASTAKALQTTLTLKLSPKDYSLNLTPHKTPTPPRPGSPNLFFRHWSAPNQKIEKPHTLYNGILSMEKATIFFHKAVFNKTERTWHVDISANQKSAEQLHETAPLLRAWAERNTPNAPYQLICGYRSKEVTEKAVPIYCTLFVAPNQPITQHHNSAP